MRSPRLVVTTAIAIAASGCMVGEQPVDDAIAGKQRGHANSNGAGDTFFSTGPIDLSGPFFQSLGTNGRSCGSCHVDSEGWTITPGGVQQRFNQTGGTDPIFRLVDGSNSPLADVSTESARRTAYSMLLNKGLIRIGIGIPAGAEFRLLTVDDPYGFASASELSLFRRPLPTTSLPYLATLMWDGRETNGDLATQAGSATLGHAEAQGIDDGQMAAIVAQEIGLFSAQVVDKDAKDLDIDYGRGGPTYLGGEPFWIGINDPLGGNPTGEPFNPEAMTLFDDWEWFETDPPNNSNQTRRRAAIFRGQQIFNLRPITITGVKGLNDALGQPSIQGTCTLCHDTPNIGNHSVALPIDIGLSDASRRTSDMPLYTLQNTTTYETIQTTDPGRALITGKWADIGKFKGPILRGLSMRAPYFHNGSAADLAAAVDFYETRFGLGLSSQERSDLIAFLSAL